MLKPSLPDDLVKLCSPSNPPTDQLLGQDLTKRVRQIREDQKATVSRPTQQHAHQPFRHRQQGGGNQYRGGNGWDRGGNGWGYYAGYNANYSSPGYYNNHQKEQGDSRRQRGGGGQKHFSGQRQPNNYQQNGKEKPRYRR